MARDAVTEEVRHAVVHTREEREVHAVRGDVVRNPVAVGAHDFRC